MHARPAVAALLLATALAALPAPAAEAAPAGLRLAELLANPDLAQGQREFVELWNAGPAAVDLAGWTLRDAPTASGSANEFTFAAGRLEPGARIVVWSNGSGDARGPSWSSSPSKAVWNDAGDAATLLSPAGEVADWLAYGSASAAAPPGFEAQPKPSAAARGLSLALADGSWQAGAPTPAFAPGVLGGVAALAVANVAPTATLSGVPGTVKPGQAVQLRLAAADGNGDSDVAAWALAANGAAIAQGQGLPPATKDLVAPAVSGPWTLRLDVTDAAGATGGHTLTVAVKDARLALQLPSGLLRFPELAPGATDVAALDWATLRNEGSEPVVPLLDVSPFSGPQPLPVDGRLSVGVAEGNGTATWLPYTGPLTPLPPIPPGGALRMTLRIDEAPVPLAAGQYGTTFAVVAA